MMPIQTLRAEQVELLVALAFEHVAQSQVAMLRMLPSSWLRPRLQRVLAELIEEGWVEQFGSGWCVPPLLQERVARYAWRNLALQLRVGTRQPLSRPLTVRELRLALYSGDAELFAFHWELHRVDFWNPFDPEWLDWLHPDICRRLIEQRVLHCGPLTLAESDYLKSRPQLLSEEVQYCLGEATLEPWELALETLEKLRNPPEMGPSLRVVWRVEVYGDGQSLTMEPVEQKRGRQGWSRGRPLALRKLSLCDYLGDTDRAICRLVGNDGFLEVALAAPHLVGHPLVVHRETGRLLEVITVRPRLEIADRARDWWLTVATPPRYRLEENRLEILLQNDSERALQAVVGEGLLVPPAGQQRLKELLADLDILASAGQ